MFETWQDAVVTLVAFTAAALVVWRTLGHWRDAGPSGASPRCDTCALKDAAEGIRDQG